MATASGDTLTLEKLPVYKEVDGFRLPGGSSAEAFRSALAYKPHRNDLFVVTYPKCGTTWVLNIVACIFKSGEPFQRAMEFLKQVPFLEITGAESAQTMERPGAIKTHLPHQLIPKSVEAKYIFIARNPKDCCVSFYHHTKQSSLYDFHDGDFKVFFELFMEGKTDFGDFFDCLMSWFDHRNDPNVLFITYEDLKRDTAAGVLRIAEFIEPQYKELLEKDEKLLHDVVRHSSFDFMKENFSNLDERKISTNISTPEQLNTNVAENHQNLKENRKWNVNMNNPTISFIRKGIVGDWRNHLSPEQSERLERKFKERTAGTNLAELWKDVM